MHKKQFYEAPDAELLVVRFEENFCGTVKSDSIQSLQYDDDDALEF